MHFLVQLGNLKKKQASNGTLPLSAGRMHTIERGGGRQKLFGHCQFAGTTFQKEASLCASIFCASIYKLVLVQV